ncbi:MAG TPA: HEAT repeat domain-containing protein [Candidatus Dormibacteraeota bacterium]|nr:HEAT repeat domain-containing protein [Candidatus Dormibacteraeota bacterium]
MKTLPRRPNLDHLRQQAKDLLAELRGTAAEPDALRLHHAQRLLAEQYGLGSWPELKRHVERLAEADRYIAAWWRCAGVGLLPPDQDALCHGMLHHPNHYVRWNCAQFLSGVAGPAAAAALVRALRDPIPKVRKHALLTMACRERELGVDLVPLLAERAIGDDNPGVRLRLVWQLRLRQSDPRAVRALARIAATDPHAGIRDVAAGRDALRGGYAGVLRRGGAEE